MSPRNHNLTGRLLRTLLGLCLLLAAISGQAIERVTFYHNDALGSPVAATDSNGTLLWRESYAPYGKRLTREAGSKHTVWYTGKPEEAAFGLSYFGARWYDPAIGRFLAMDPAGFDPDNIHSFGRYAYANDNPYAYVDPDGRESIVSGNTILIRTENNSIPPIPPLPNNVGAKGVSPSDTGFHQYNFTSPSNLSLTQAGNGIKNNPTPGHDSPATPAGTLNDVGAIAIFPGPNLVRSYLVPSPDPSKYSDITVNYTVSGHHTLDEGFVIRYGEVGGALRTYGEGNALKQKNPIANAFAKRAWNKNNQQIIRDAK